MVHKSFEPALQDADQRETKRVQHIDNFLAKLELLTVRLLRAFECKIRQNHYEMLPSFLLHKLGDEPLLNLLHFLLHSRFESDTLVNDLFGLGFSDVDYHILFEVTHCSYVTGSFNQLLQGFIINAKGLISRFF